MKKWLLMVSALLLTACSSGEIIKAIISCLWLPTAVGKARRAGNRQLWVEQVAVPDYLAGNGVVYQTSDVKYVIATNNLWASPLDQQLRNTLVANPGSQLPGWVVASQPLGNDQDTLNVTVTGFHGRYDGAVVISGEWLLNHQGQLIKRPFHLELKQQKDGYDEMVKVWRSGMGAGVGQYRERDFPTAISKIHHQKPQSVCR